MSNKDTIFTSLWNNWWLNVAAILVVLGLMLLFLGRAVGGEVEFIRGAYPATSQSIATQASEIEHESFDLVGDFVAQGIAGDSTVTWTIPLELTSDVEQMTWGLYGALFSSQVTWDGEVVGGVGSFSETSDVDSTIGRIMVTVPPEQSLAGHHELQLTVVGKYGEGRMSGELVWGTRAEVLSHYRHLRFLTYMVEGAFTVLAITFLLIAAFGFQREEFLIWGWYLFSMSLITPAFSGMWDLFSESGDLQRRIQFVGMVVVPLSTILQPAWMGRVHRKKWIVVPVVVLSVIGILAGSILDLRTLVLLRNWVGVLALLVVVAATIWIDYLAFKGNREAKFFAVIAVLLGVGAVSAIIATMGLTADYQLMLPCAAISSAATAVYFIVRHSSLANRYAILLDSVGDGIIVVDRGGIIREANLAAKNLLGGKLGQFKDSLRKSEYEIFTAHAYGARVGHREEFHLDRENGNTVVESISVNLIDGTTLLSLRDIRERMELELEMAQAARIETTELVVIELARDLRSCVSSISAAADRLKSVCSKGKAKNRYDRFVDVLGRCSDLGDQLSMLASGVGVEAQEFILDDALRGVLDSLDQSLGEKVTVHRKLGVSGLMVLGVIQEIESIFVNLIFNSRDALGDNGGNVWIESQKNGDVVDISFEDDGPGIPEELRERVWEPFFSTKARGHGGGVGLSVVARVIRRHNGQCIIERGDRAGGARLVVSLPIASTLTL
mgnify:CR=1 FL=1